MDQQLSTQALQQLNAGLLIVSQEGRVIFCNQWFALHCPLEREEIIHQRIETLFPRFSEKRIQKALSDAMEFGVTSTLSYSIHKNIFPLLKVNGEPVDHAVTINGLTDSAEHAHALIQVTDVSSATKRERILRQSRLDAEEANRAKDEFLAAMSHELRTPLTTIIGNSELLAETETDQTRLEQLHSIEVAGRAQLSLVNDVLDMSKIEAGKFTIDNTPYNLAVLLEDIRQIFSLRAHDAGLHFKIRMLRDEPFLLTGDAQRIGQILINIIGNAIKFTEHGGVSLTAAQRGSKLLFRIEDTGIGMSAETIKRLFQCFEQADTSISRRFGGTGLGLFISRNLANLMQGTIHVESKEGVGSIFELALPYQPSEIPAEQRSSTHAPVLNATMSGAVLVAEDTPEIQLLERRILERLGLTVTVANNGREAVELCSRHHFDLILMDMQMPEMDGIEATQRLRSAGNETPIIALTANVMQRHRQIFQQAGCSDFLSKPIDKQELQLVLKRHLRAAPPPPAHREEEVDEELIRLFAQSSQNNRTLLQQGLAENNWKSIYQAAHNIKGSALSFGFPQLGALGKTVCDAINSADGAPIEEADVQALLTSLEQAIASALERSP